MDPVAAVGVVVAAAALVVSLLERRRALRAEAGADMRAERTERTALEATRAAEAAARAQERMATALEQQAAAAAMTAPQPEVAWRLEHSGGDLYTLTNAGSGTAYSIGVDAPGLVAGPDVIAGLLQLESVAPGESVRFLSTATTADALDYPVSVMWWRSPDSAAHMTWRRSLPPRAT